MRSRPSVSGLLLMALLGTAALAVSREARADTSGPTAGDRTSTGTASLAFESSKRLDTTIDTGFLGPAVAQVRAIITIDPVKGGGPLYRIEMPRGAVVDASWSNDKKIVLRAASGATTDGSVAVRHTLTPSVDLKVSAFGLGASFSFSAESIVNKLPGAKFAYDSSATTEFAPWGFTKVDTKLDAPALASSVLFSQPLDVLGLDPADWAGQLGVRATTKPTFSYRTTKVTLGGARGTIAAAADEAVIDAVDGDALDLVAQVEGSMDVAGSMDVQPFVSFTKVFGFGFSTSIGITAVTKDYVVPTAKVTYPAAMVHIPLPNVHVPTAALDLGEVKLGSTTSKTVTIQNSGEKAAVMTFAASDPQFTVPADRITVPSKGSYELAVQFAPTSAGGASATVTVTSNDPDAPEQVFALGANGAEASKPAATTEAEVPTEAAADSGCGCRTTGTSSRQGGGMAALGLLGVGLVLARRRAAR